RLKTLQKYSAAADVFLDKNHKNPKVGYLIKQPDLANTLNAIAQKGLKGFYAGDVAATLVNSVQKAGGIWQLDDLKKYNVIERDVIESEYQGFKLISAPPPSSGGIAIAQMLNMLDSQAQANPWQTLNESDQVHLLSEVMRRAYFDRAHYLGDPDFVD
ncbi:gamma-glutamyltransferase, partial [Bermanella sp. 47_1433_sub80_T6]